MILPLIEEAIADTDVTWPGKHIPPRTNEPVGPAFWNLYRKGGKGLQSTPTTILESGRRLKFPESLDPTAKARLLSMSVPGASYWLSSLDTPGAPSLSNTEFRLALRMRLGLPLLRDGIQPYCKCKKSVDDGYHFFTCTGVEKTTRHNLVAAEIQSLCRTAGLHYEREESFILKASDHALRLGGVVHIPDAKNNHACIDVSIVHPTSKSYLQGAQKTLGAAKEAYKKKLKHYQEWIEIQEEDLSRHVLVPFIMESYGAFHREAKRFLERVYAIAR